jgi:putative PIN family toxin of toxin-antitoxin system
MSTAPLGVVFDCVILLQAAVSDKGPSFACRELLDSGTIRVFLSPVTLAEITDVLGRPEVRKRFKALTPDRADAFLRDLTGKATSISEVPHQFSYERDPDDEPYVNLALAAGARYLVTWDDDLLALMREDNPAGKDFRARYPTLSILTPVALLREFAPKTEDKPTTEESSR